MVTINAAIKQALLNSIARCNEVATPEEQEKRLVSNPTMWRADFTCVVLCSEIVKAIPDGYEIPQDEYLELLKAACTEVGNPDSAIFNFKKGQAHSMVMMAKNWGINIPAVMAKYPLTDLKEVSAL